MAREVIWSGPTTCDFDGMKVGDRLVANWDHDCSTTIIDGSARFASWSVMCPKCHAKFGIGLGVGKGQKYERREDGAYVKVAG